MANDKSFLDNPTLEFDGNDLDDKSLCDAWKKCEETGSYHPLILYEMKIKIQIDRNKRGEPEMIQEPKIEPHTITKQIKMSPKQQASRQRKRKSNQISAMKLRQRKKEYERKLSHRVSTLQVRNHDMIVEIRNLNREIHYLRHLLNHHPSVMCARTDMSNFTNIGFNIVS